MCATCDSSPPNIPTCGGNLTNLSPATSESFYKPPIARPISLISERNIRKTTHELLQWPMGILQTQRGGIFFGVCIAFCCGELRLRDMAIKDGKLCYITTLNWNAMYPAARLRKFGISVRWVTCLAMWETHRLPQLC